MKHVLVLMLALMVLTGCSRKNEEQLFREAQAAETQKDFYTAVERYRELTERFAGGANAEKSFYRIAVIYNNDLRDYEQAVKAYQKFVEVFPRSKDAPTALFLSGFILANELKNLPRAKATYEAFLQKYPGHELAQSAKFELQTLGKDPSQIIGEHTATPDGAIEEK